jgi:hypothetical protein
MGRAAQACGSGRGGAVLVLMLVLVLWEDKM